MSGSLRWLWCLAPWLVAGACVDEPPQHASAPAPIINGSDNDGDPHVVGLVAAGSIYCTGTLIAPRVVLTAGHCIDEVVPQRVFFGASIDLGGSFVDVVERHPHPELDRSNLDNDIGVVVLAEPAPSGASPVPMRVEPLEAAFVGEGLRLVGFGATGQAGQEDGRKRQGATVVDSVEDTTFRFGPSPAQTCTGDSGGPAFHGTPGDEMVVGVTSTGDPACEVYGLDTRVDAYTRDFICPLLEELGQTPAAACPVENPEGCCSTGAPDLGSTLIAAAAIALALVRRRSRA